VQAVRSRCGDAAFARAHAEGETFTLEQAIADALQGTINPVTLWRWQSHDIAHWQQEAPTADDGPAARAVLVSPLAEPLALCHTVIPSWQATTPPGTWMELHLHALIDTRWTRCYRLMAWDTATRRSQRRSFAHQRDADGWVDTETLRLNHHAKAVQARVVLCAERADAWPELHQLALCLSSRSRGSRHGERRNLSSAPFQVAEPLPLPSFSQYAYPQGAGWCSPTSLAMVLGYWHHRTGDHRLLPFTSPSCVPDLVAPLVDDPNYGSGNWSFNVAYAASLGLDAWVTQLGSLNQVARWVAAGVPVICSLAWEEGELEHAPLPRSDGHLVVVTGLRADGQVMVADPAGADATQVCRLYQVQPFAACWQRHSAGTVYLVYPPGWTTPSPYPGDPW
jgi:hypothetical protein